MASASSSTGFFRTLCWAVYLGCSWTWCIGMFLPVILVSEFGMGAWFVFAIPNVIGAAAMGWTLSRPGASERVMAEHRTACSAFSAVTFAFHLFFLYWLTHAQLIPHLFAIGSVSLGVVFGVIGRKRIALDFILGFLVLSVSLAVFGRGLEHPVFGVLHPIEIQQARSAIIGLVPACLLGFLLCPYLDVSFHRARQGTSSDAGKAAFMLGFGVIFALMIILTLMYAGDFALDKNTGDRFGSFGGALLISWVALHISAQAGFTFAVHLRALPRFRTGDWVVWLLAALTLWPAAISVQQKGWLRMYHSPIIMLDGLFTYRMYMSFYGLVFPAYVWLCMVPIGRCRAAATRRSLSVLAIAIVIAAPMYWLGFIQEKTLWLVPAVAVILLARTLTNCRPSDFA